MELETWVKYSLTKSEVFTFEVKHINTHTHIRQHSPYKELHTSTKQTILVRFKLFPPITNPYFPLSLHLFLLFLFFQHENTLAFIFALFFFNVSCVFSLFFSSSVCLCSIITVVSTYCAKERPPLFLPSPSGRVSPCLMWHRQSKSLESSRAEIKRQGWSVRDKEDSGCDKHRENLHVTWQGPSARRTWFLLLLKV